MNAVHLTYKGDFCSKPRLTIKFRFYGALNNSIEALKQTLVSTDLKK
ncbi:MAG: hypothetical protein ACI9O6_001721 [Glaciecola sp.]|jgi:hypothetical protein